MAVLTNSSRDAADHATDRLPDAVPPTQPSADVEEARASLKAHIAAGGCLTEWLKLRAARIGRAA